MHWIALLLLLFLFTSSCTRPPVVEAPKTSFNLALVSFDTARSDYLQLYNQAGAPTPNLNKIAAQSYVFQNAIAQAPYTLPSHCTLFTGTLPKTHGVQENSGVVLPQHLRTLAESLKNSGYHTAGFAGAMVLSASTGVARGFDYYDDSFTSRDLKTKDLSGIQRSSETVLNALSTWLDREKPDRYFAFLHFYDAHDPYQPPQQFMPANREIKELYKGELRYVDSVIGMLYDKLHANGQFQKTIFVVAGDHGEMLGEHGENTHGYFVYPAAIEVPLLIHVPGMNQRKDIRTPVMIAEVMPTVLDLMSIPIPGSVETKSIRQIMDQNSETRAVYSESHTPQKYFGSKPLITIRDSFYQYIDTSKPELYDIRKDRAAQMNLVSEKSTIAAKMKNELQSMLQKQQTGSAVKSETISNEQAEQLAALGYISGGSLQAIQGRDAKDFIQSWRDLNKLNDLLREDRFREAQPLIEKIRIAGVSGDYLDIFEARMLAGLNQFEKSEKLLRTILNNSPDHLAAKTALGRVLEKSGRIEEASDLYRDIAEQQKSPYSLDSYARQMFRLNRQQELLAYLRSAEAAGKFDDRFSTSLGEIYLNLKQIADAEKHLSRAVELNPDSEQAAVLLAMVLDAQNKTVHALAVLEGGAGKFNGPEYLLQLGLIYHRTGDRIRERQTFERLMNEHSSDPRGYFYLARFLLDQGANPQTVIELAQKGLSLNPPPDFMAFGYYLISGSFEAAGRKEEAQHYRNLAEKSLNRSGL